jgi:hypothetical protein
MFSIDLHDVSEVGCTAAFKGLVFIKCTRRYSGYPMRQVFGSMQQAIRFNRNRTKTIYVLTSATYHSYVSIKKT